MKGKVTKHLNIRRGSPSVSAVCKAYYEPGVELEITQKVKGDSIDGNFWWYTLAENQYIWSGGLNVDPDLISEDSGEVFSHPNYSKRATNLSLLGWNITSLGINKIWEDTRFGEGVKIALLDSGIQSDHPEFSSVKKNTWSILKNKKEVPDGAGHGTHCAGIIGAQGQQLFGAAPACELLIVQVYSNDNDLTIENVIMGIEWAAQNGAEVISMSLAFSDDFPGLDKLHEVIKKYADKIIFVAAAGNFGETEEEVNQFPASFPECISVGALTQEGKRYSRSNISRNLTLMAPGENIKSTYNNSLYKELSDTSFAAPLVSAVLGLMLAYVKQHTLELSPKAIVDIIKHTCDDSGKKGKDYEYGFGIINPINALTKIKNYSIA